MLPRQLFPRRTLLQSRLARTATPRRQPFHLTARPGYPKKSDQDKDTIDTSSSEYSKSGGDDMQGANDAAFNPSKTRPEEEHNAARGKEGDSNNPLNVSPANQDVSKPRGAQEGGSQGSEGETGSGTGRSSGGGSPKKSGGGKSG